MSGGRGIGAAEQGSLAPWQRAANMVYDHPFKTIIGIAVPCYLAIFHRESTNPATAQMLLSQRLIHTRVYGQGVVVLVHVTTVCSSTSVRKVPVFSRFAAMICLARTSSILFNLSSLVNRESWSSCLNVALCTSVTRFLLDNTSTFLSVSLHKS